MSLLDNVRPYRPSKKSGALVKNCLGTGPTSYHIQVAATIGYYTGMRKAESLALQWDKHIDMEQHCIRLERKQTKTNTSRGLYMTYDFLKVMLKAKEV